MSGFPILDLVIGLIFIFFMLSIICSAVVESILSTRKIRNKVLTQWLLTIFDKRMIQPDGKVVKLGQAIMDHCLTTALSNPGEANSFMDAKNFVSALIEKLSYNPEKPEEVIQDMEQLLVAIRNGKAIDGTSLLSTELQRTILIFASEAKMLAPSSVSGSQSSAGAGSSPAIKNSFQLFREKMENWFDTSMDRIGGTMKRKYTRPITFWIGLIVVIALNADTLQIARYLYNHKEEAKTLADNAVRVSKNMEATHILPGDTLSVKQLKQTIDTFKAALPKGLPLGWQDVSIRTGEVPGDIWRIVSAHFFGWIATVMAIMLGAPFWFDLLNKVVNIRGSGNKPASSTDKDTSSGK